MKKTRLQFRTRKELWFVINILSILDISTAFRSHVVNFLQAVCEHNDHKLQKSLMIQNDITKVDFHT